MTAYWLAQGVGVIAFLIGITTFINRDERRFKQQLALYSGIIGLHFILMGALPAGMSAGLNAVRTLISLRTRNLWIMVIFIALTLIPASENSSMRWNCCRWQGPSPAPGPCFAVKG